jgi:hypothetical protein
MSKSEEAMLVALATAYHDANDRMFDQIARLLPVISSIFPHIAVQASSMAPQRSLQLLQQAGAAIEQASAAEPTGAAQLGNVRRLALNLALRSHASVVMYFDFDSLLHWIETYPDELRSVVTNLGAFDMTIIGRTPRAFDTHPESQRVTEAWVNRAFARLTGHAWDVMRSGRGISRRAAETIVAECDDARISTDVSWPLHLLKHGTFTIEGIQVEGTEFETADRYRPEIDHAGDRFAWMEKLDADPRRWAHRCNLARMHMEAMIPYAEPSTRLE